MNEVDIMVETVQKAWSIPCIIPGVDIGGLGREDQELIAEHGFWGWINGMAKAFGPNPIVVPATKAPKTRRECPNCRGYFYSTNRQFCSKECRAAVDRQQHQNPR